MKYEHYEKNIHIWFEVSWGNIIVKLLLLCIFSNKSNWINSNQCIVTGHGLESWSPWFGVSVHIIEVYLYHIEDNRQQSCKKASAWEKLRQKRIEKVRDLGWSSRNMNTTYTHAHKHTTNVASKRFISAAQSKQTDDFN